MQCPCLKDFSGIQPLATSHSWLRGHLYVLHPGWLLNSVFSQLCQWCSSLFCNAKKKKPCNSLYWKCQLSWYAVWYPRRESRCYWMTCLTFTLTCSFRPAVPRVASEKSVCTRITHKLPSGTRLYFEGVRPSITISYHTNAKPGGNVDTAAVALVWYNTHNYWAK